MNATYAKIIPPYRPPRRTLGERWRGRVRIETQVLKAVAFLCVNDARGRNQPGVTALFVSVPEGADLRQSDNDEWTSGDTFNYVVTARHCIEDNKGDVPIFVRMNTAGGGFADMETSKCHWIKHNGADVATMLLTEPPPDAEIEAIPIRLFVRRDY